MCTRANKTSSKHKGQWTGDQDGANDLLQQLDYFAEWGGRVWRRLLQHTFHQFLGVNLQGRQILDIGTRFGKMGSLFSLLGAKVIGVDLSRTCLSVARKEATKWNVTDRIVFVMGAGDSVHLQRQFL